MFFTKYRNELSKSLLSLDNAILAYTKKLEAEGRIIEYIDVSNMTTKELYKLLADRRAVRQCQINGK